MKKILPILLILLYSCNLEHVDDNSLLIEEFFRNISIYIEEYSTPKIIETEVEGEIEEIEVFCGLSLKLQPKSDSMISDLKSLEIVRISDELVIASEYEVDESSNEIEFWDIISVDNSESITAGEYKIVATFKNDTEIEYSFFLYNRSNGKTGEILTRSVTNSNPKKFIMPEGEEIIPSVTGSYLFFTFSNPNEVENTYILLSRNGESYFSYIDLIEVDKTLIDNITSYSYMLVDSGKSENSHSLYYRYHSSLVEL